MTTKEIDFDGTTVLVHKTDDGFEAKEKEDEAGLVQRFVDSHPCIERMSVSSGDKQDYVLYLDPETSHIAPGRGNIGTGRTDAARDHLTRNDLDLSVEWMEPKSGPAELWSVGITVEDNR